MTRFEGTIGQLISGMAQTITALLNIGTTYAPLSSAAELPIGSFRPERLPFPPPEFIPPQAIPPVSPPLSRTIMESPAYQSLNRIREQQRQRIERLTERSNLPDGRSAARGIAEASSMQGAFHNVRPDFRPGNEEEPNVSNASPPMVFQPALAGLALQETFRQLLNPSGGFGLPVLQEDPRWIQENLSHAARPLSLQDQLQMAQARQQADLQQQVQQAQLAAAQAQQEMYQAQTRMLRERQQQNEVQKYGFRGWKAAPMAVPPSGEQAKGAKSHLPPKPLVFRDDVDLSKLLWQHFLTGEGQPVEIDLSKLDFSENINVSRLLSSARRLLLNPKVKTQALQKAFHKKLSVSGNGKVTHIIFDEPLLMSSTYSRIRSKVCRARQSGREYE